MRTISMSIKELRKISIMEKLLSSKISQKGAAISLGCTKRTIRRLLARYRSYGALGLLHKRRGKSGNRALDPQFKRKILDLVKTKYSACGPTFTQIVEKFIKLTFLMPKKICL